jgi:transcriptional regulator with XRE-family HTH domain
MRFEAFGKWLKSQRLARGIRSAAVLSKRAGLSTNYVSILERGEFRAPAPDTVERLAKAMGMSPTEHMDFLRRATLAGEPESVQAALTAAPFPGVVLWKHLPHALARVPYRCGGFVFASPDHVLVKVILRSRGVAGLGRAYTERPKQRRSAAQSGRLVEEPYRRRITTAVRSPQWSVKCGRGG